jgi:hypothetical protein
LFFCLFCHWCGQFVHTREKGEKKKAKKKNMDSAAKPRKLVTIATYMAASLAAVFINRFLLVGAASSPPRPASVACQQTAASAVLMRAVWGHGPWRHVRAAIIGARGSAPGPHRPNRGAGPPRALWGAAAAYSLMLALNGVCLAGASLPFYQVARSLTPLWSALMTR